MSSSQPAIPPSGLRWWPQSSDPVWLDFPGRGPARQPDRLPHRPGVGAGPPGRRLPGRPDPGRGL